jgi:hypothetical protein
MALVKLRALEYRVPAHDEMRIELRQHRVKLASVSVGQREALENVLSAIAHGVDKSADMSTLMFALRHPGQKNWVPWGLSKRLGCQPLTFQSGGFVSYVLRRQTITLKVDMILLYLLPCIPKQAVSF